MARTRLTLEALEDRSVPATWGNPWPDATHLTLSFAPDGTDIGGGQTSSLFHTLGSNTQSWQRAILRAFQTWAAEAGVSVGVVADGGQAFGIPGRPQGDSRFGDIRVGAGSYTNNELIFTAPYDLTGGTHAGDVRINTRLWGSTNYDLYTAMLQEAGHALGIGNSNDPASVMFEEYQGVRSGLSAGDVASIRAIYGARPADRYEGNAGNATLGTATQLNLLADAGGVLGYAAEADLTSRTDVDVYRFTAPSLAGGLQLTLERAGLSLLTPRVTVYNSAGQVVGSAVSTDPRGGDLTVRVGGLLSLGSYYVKVQGASGEAFDVGSYRLNIQSLAVADWLTTFTGQTVQSLAEAATRNDLHTNDSLATSQNLLATVFAPGSKFNAGYQAAISDSWDVDYYRVRAPAAQGDNALQIMAWGTGRSQVVPRLAVYNAAGALLPAEVLTKEGGAVAIQIAGYTPGATYYIRVTGAQPGVTGSYFLGVDFSSVATRLDTLREGQLSATTPAVEGQMTVTRTGLFHFVLATDASNGTGVEMTIRNSQGVIVGRLAVGSGSSASLTVTLPSGAYTVRFTAFRTDGQALTPVRFRLRGIVLTDPVGPRPTDTSGSNSGGGSNGNNNGGWYYYDWSGNSTSGGPGSQDPYGSSYAV